MNVDNVYTTYGVRHGSLSVVDSHNELLGDIAATRPATVADPEFQPTAHYFFLPFPSPFSPLLLCFPFFLLFPSDHFSSYPL